MGSLNQGVSLFSPLLVAQVNPSPPSVTIVPKASLARTFDQGDGVVATGSRQMTESTLSGAKPPQPLSNCKSDGLGSGEEACMAAEPSKGAHEGPRRPEERRVGKEGVGWDKSGGETDQ